MADSPKSQSQHPPKPRLTLRVGITGHRPNKLSAEAVGRVEQQLSAVFAAIEAAASSIHRQNAAFYAEEGPAIRLTCGFAEGVDLIAVARCPESWQIEAVLPFPRDEYLKDFQESAAGDGRNVSAALLEALKKAATITELPAPLREDRNKSYTEAGGYLLRQVDLLIAVWDGDPPKPGGTGALARKAFDNGIPTLWISLGEDLPRLITGFDQAGAPTASDANYSDGPLEDALLPVFGAPASNQGEVGRKSSRAILVRYLNEVWHHHCYWTAFDFLKRIATLHWPRIRIRAIHPDERRNEWASFLDDAPAVANLRSRLERILLPRFIWADELAVHFSHRYRSVYVLAYLLSALAVIIALAGNFIEHEEKPLQTRVIFVFFELVVIGFILGIVVVGRYWLWHERWLQYRTLAENLRHARFLAFVSEFGQINVPPPEPESHDPSWVIWYIRATMREIGLPAALFDGSYQWRLLKATLSHELDSQINWHKSNRGNARRMDHILHYFGIGCFIFTFVVLIVFLTAYVVHWWTYGLIQLDNDGNATTALGALLLVFKPIVTLMMAGLPALGAALAGIRVQSDFAGSRERSEHMIDILSKLADDFRKAAKRPTALNETAEMLINTGHAMSEDVAAWQELYGRKRLTLPA